jgi:diacylglycerol kinase family enzyme
MEAARPTPPVVVVNPTASRLHDAGRRSAIVAAVTRAVETRTGHTPILVDASPEAARAALAAATTAPLVAVVGGDGTVREVVASMAGSDVPVAIVPAGTGNVFAAALGIPRRTSAALEFIRAGQPAPIDVGRASWGPVLDGAPGPAAGAKVFVVACGLGFDARVMAGATTDLKRRLGFGAYVVSAVRQAARLRPTTFRIEADGDVREVRGLVVLIANCGHIIPGLIGPRHPISPTDGRLDVFVVTAGGVPTGLVGAAELLFADAATSRNGGRSLRLRVQRIRITADPPEPVEVDGDPHAADWLEADILPGAIRVICS